MKKLMIVAAAALCATAFADIESANTVGYVETPVQGFKMITPSFKNITGEDYPLDNFIVKGADDAMASVQVLDANGQVVGDYYWFNAFDEYPAGWFDMSGAESAGISLKPGEAVLFYTKQEGVSVLSAGEVPGAITHGIAGFSMFGNGSPVEIDVDTMTVQGADDAMTSIQVLDGNGQVVGDYYWFNAFEEYPAGWFDMSGAESAGISLAPGEAVLFYTKQSGVSATVPAAIAE